MGAGQAPAECVAVTKQFGEFSAVTNLDLIVPAGSVTGFLGPNGAGKTTVLRLLAGITQPTSGQVLLWGRPASEAPARTSVGDMPADPAFIDHLSGQANLDLFARLQGAAAVDQHAACQLL